MAEQFVDMEENKIFSYRYGRYLSKGTLVIAVALAIGGLYLFLANIDGEFLLSILGFIMFGIGFFAFIPVELFQLNFKTREYRNCIKIFSFQKGEWKPLGKVQYLSIVTQTKFITMPGPGLMGASIDKNVYDCNLRFFIKAGYYIDIEDFDSKPEAIELGRLISKGLNLDFIDATVKPAKFIN